MGVLRERLGDDAILTCGAGNFTVWAHRFYAFRQYPTQLAPRSGSMGYGFPAAVAAKAAHPERDVVCVAGDGDFLMTGQELATAVQHGLGVVVLVVDNGMYGTIRMHQERNYPGRVVATDLSTPTSSPTPAPSARTVPWSSAPRTSPPPSTRRSPRAARRCCTCASTRRRSRRARR